MPRQDTAPPERAPATPAVLPMPFEGRLGCSVDEAAEALDLERDSIYRMIADGRLVASKLGRRTIVHVASIHRLLADTTVVPRPRVRRDAAPASPPAAQSARSGLHRRGKAVQVLQTASATTS